MAHGSIRWIWTLAPHVFCISVFLVQLFQLLPTYFAPSMTYTEVSNVQLKDIDFPLDFKICVKPLLNKTALQQFGYLSTYHYTVGGSPDNTLIGWAGHNSTLWAGHKNNSAATASAEEVVKATRMDVTKHILSGIYISAYGGNSTENLVNTITLDKINWLYECFTLNLSNVRRTDLNGMEGVAIYFNRTEDIVLKTSFELRVMGTTLASRREIQEHRLYASGNAMKLSSGAVKRDTVSSFIVKIKKNVFVEEDRTKNCRNYPNHDFDSYKNCDFQFMKNKVKEIAPGMNLMPPWLTDDLNNVTSKPVKFSSFVSYQLGRLFLGIANSDCPLPCTTISTEAKITDKFEHVEPGFILQFPQTVEVTLLNGGFCEFLALA